MKIDETIFRKYDIRGKYPAELNEEAAYAIALGFANTFPDVKTVVVGGDIRTSTPPIKKALIKGLIDGGKKVIDVGTVITPVVYFAVCHYAYDAGIVTTASHLGGAYNGIKFVLKNAYPTLPKDYDAIKNLIMNEKLKIADKKYEEVETKAVENDYIEEICKRFKIDKALKIIVDNGNGAARLLPEKIFKRLGCEVTTLYAEPDDQFPNHVPDPYEIENMQDLIKEVERQKADIGIGFDGDGDRVGFILSNGRFITGDELLMLYTLDAFEKKPGPIAVDARASMALIEEVKKRGQQIVLTVGYHAAVLDKIIELGAVFGGETTSHFYFPLDFYLTDDAILSSLKLIEIASRHKDFISYLDSLPNYATGEEIFIPFPDETKYQTVDKLVELAKSKGLDVNDVDGARVNFANGWFIVRPSNTSPFIKVKAEGKIKKDLKEVQLKLMELLVEVGIKIPNDLKPLFELK